MIEVKKCVLYTSVFLPVFFSLHYLNVLIELALFFIAIWATDYILYRIKDPFNSRPLLPDLRDKAVVITGCDTGFGHELACRLDSIGVKVFAGCLFPEGSGALKLKAQCSENLHLLHLDITNEDHIHSAVKEVSTSLGHKDLWALVNNAGIITYGEFELCSMKKMQLMIDVNVSGTLRTTQAFLPLIRKSHGRLVIVASIAGRLTVNGMVAYAMTKHATVALGDGLRCELMKFGVSVHTIEPWFYSTNLNNAEVRCNDLRESWSEAPKEVTDDYGEDFLQEYMNHVVNGQQHMNPPSKMHEVVDDMIHATVGENPKIQYEEGTIWFVKLLGYLPTPFMDYFNYYASPKRIIKC